MHLERVFYPLLIFRLLKEKKISILNVFLVLNYRKTA